MNPTSVLTCLIIGEISTHHQIYQTYLTGAGLVYGDTPQLHQAAGYTHKHTHAKTKGYTSYDTWTKWCQNHHQTLMAATVLSCKPITFKQILKYSSAHNQQMNHMCWPQCHYNSKLTSIIVTVHHYHPAFGTGTLLLWPVILIKCWQNQSQEKLLSIMMLGKLPHKEFIFTCIQYLSLMEQMTPWDSSTEVKVPHLEF